MTMMVRTLKKVRFVSISGKEIERRLYDNFMEEYRQSERANRLLAEEKAKAEAKLGE